MPTLSKYSPNRVGIRNSTDYSPFGVELDGRTVSLDGYRFGFQGYESDDEVKGPKNEYRTQFRQYDPRIGRWQSQDSKSRNYPAWSTYAGNGNNPIINVDIDGNDFIFFAGAGYAGDKEKKQFNLSMTKSMRSILGCDFFVAQSVNKGALQDVGWALAHGGKPITNINKNDVMKAAVGQLDKVIGQLDCDEPLNIVGSCYGAVVAAQATLYALEHREEFGIEETKVSLTITSKMLDSDSELYEALVNKAEEDPNFKLLVQDFPEDNVDGVCGKKASQGFVQMFRIPFPHITASGKRESGMFKKIKNGGTHTHTIMSESTAKTYDLIRWMLVSNDLENGCANVAQNKLDELVNSEKLNTKLESPDKKTEYP
jgi:RHS repeat-associated protein